MTPKKGSEFVGEFTSTSEEITYTYQNAYCNSVQPKEAPKNGSEFVGESLRRPTSQTHKTSCVEVVGLKILFLKRRGSVILGVCGISFDLAATCHPQPLSTTSRLDVYMLTTSSPLSCGPDDFNIHESVCEFVSFLPLILGDLL